MHLRRIEIQNYRAIHRQDIPFEDALGRVRPVTVIAGPNGSGKTTVLLAIVQALRGALGARLPDVDFPDDNDIHRLEVSGRVPVVASVTLEICFENAEMDAIRRVLKDTAEIRELAGKSELKPPALTDGRMRVEWQYPPRIAPDGERKPVAHLEGDPRYAAVWLSGARYAWGGFRRRRLSRPTDLYTIGMLRFFSQTRDRRWGLENDDSGGDASDAHEWTTEVTSAKAPLPGMTVREALRRLGEWAHGQGLPENDERRKWEGVLQERFKRICSPKEYRGYWLDHARFGETPLLADGGREYPFVTAASGEHVILHYLTQFAFPRPVNNSLILIDEPELHLHPLWIRQLYRALPEMGDNNQFILVTHSPELRQLAAEDNALVDLGNLGEPVERAGRAQPATASRGETD